MKVLSHSLYIIFFDSDPLENEFITPKIQQFSQKRRFISYSTVILPLPPYIYDPDPSVKCGTHTEKVKIFLTKHAFFLYLPSILPPPNVTKTEDF